MWVTLCRTSKLTLEVESHLKSGGLYIRCWAALNVQCQCWTCNPLHPASGPNLRVPCSTNFDQLKLFIRPSKFWNIYIVGKLQKMGLKCYIYLGHLELSRWIKPQSSKTVLCSAASPSSFHYYYFYLHVWQPYSQIFTFNHQFHSHPVDLRL